MALQSSQTGFSPVRPRKPLSIGGGLCTLTQGFPCLELQNPVHDLVCPLCCSDNYDCKCCSLLQPGNLNEADGKQNDSLARCDETFAVLSHGMFGVINSV